MTASVDDVVLAVSGLEVELRGPAGTGRGVRGVDFALHRGRTLALVGESGCGKSLTASAIVQLHPRPVSRIVAGSVWFEGRDLVRLSERDLRRVRGSKIAMVLQDSLTALNPLLTIGRQIEEVLARHERLKGRHARERVLELLRMVRMPEPARRAGQYPHQLSGGMRQRAAAAVAVACRPVVLIADEPTAALDVTLATSFVDLLRRLQDETGMSILLITHDIGIVRDAADHVAIMYRGRIVEDGDTAELLGRPAHPYTVGLLRSVPGLALDAPTSDPIPGQVPSIFEPVIGCSFRDRCGVATATCDTPPPRTTPMPGRSVECWYAGR